MANTHSLDLESSSSQYAYITDANQTGLDLTSTFTLEGWIKFESFLSLWNWFIFKANSSLSADQRSYFFGYYHSDTSLRLGIYNGTKNNQSQVSWKPELDTWYHVAVTFDSNQVKFFVNGSQQGTTQTNTYSSANNGSADFNFGTDKTTGYTDGKFDDWRVWNVVRTPTEIAANYQKELVGNESGLVGYWKFNNNAEDTTSNNNDLTLSGSPSYSTDVPTWPIAYSLVCALGTFTLTGINATLKYAHKLAMAVGSFTLTGIDVAFKKMGKGLVAEVGNFVLTGKDATLKSARTAWTNDTKPTSSWTNDDK